MINSRQQKKVVGGSITSSNIRFCTNVCQTSAAKMTQINNNELVSEDVIKLLKETVEETGLTDLEITTEEGSVKGDNYMGIIAKVIVKGKNNKGKETKQHFMVKSAPGSLGFRNSSAIRLAYEREIFVYAVLLPEFMKFQENKKIKKPFKSFAKCFKTSVEYENESLIMEDMRQSGFVMKDRKIPLDIHHVSLVLKQLAKFHALSYAIRDQDHGLFNMLKIKMEKNFMNEINKEEFRKHNDVIFDKARKVFHPVKEADIIKKFDECIKAFHEDIWTIFPEDRNGPYAVIRHADTWTNNILFAYEVP